MPGKGFAPPLHLLPAVLLFLPAACADTGPSLDQGYRLMYGLQFEGAARELRRVDVRVGASRSHRSEDLGELACRDSLARRTDDIRGVDLTRDGARRARGD